MGKAPSFQFYPADWLNDVKLQSCSLEAQGLLINIMCLMHQAKPYGYLLINDHTPTHKEVARLLRLHHKTYQARLKELLLYGALQSNGNGIIFSNRMIKDEQLRKVRRAAGKQGGNPLLKQKVNQASKQKTTPSSSSSSSPSLKNKKKVKKKKSPLEKPKQKHLDYVLLTEAEKAKLDSKFGSNVNPMIECLNNYIGSSGKNYKSHYFALLGWVADKFSDSNDNPSGSQPPCYTLLKKEE